MHHGSHWPAFLLKAIQLIHTLYALHDPADILGRPSVQQIVRLTRLTIQAGYHHMIRGLDPQITSAPAARVDTAVENVVLGLLGMHQGPSEATLGQYRARLRLPIAMGGFGFQSLARGAGPAHLASWMMFARLVVERVPGLIPPPGPGPPPGLAPGVQPLAPVFVAAAGPRCCAYRRWWSCVSTRRTPSRCSSWSVQ